MGIITKRSIGIDFSSEEATFAEASKVLGRVRAVRPGYLQLPGRNGVSRTDAASFEPAAKREKDRAEDLAAMSKVDEVVVGLPRRCCVLRFLEFPDLDEAELKGLVAYELERHLPFPPDKAWYGFQKLERREGKARLLLLAAKREDVEGFLDRVAQLGLQPTAVDASSFAAVNAFLFDRHGPSGDLRSLVSVHGNEAEVSVVKGRVLLSSRAVSIGDGSFEPIVTELKRVAEAIPGGPGKVFVSGESNGLALRLKEELSIETEQWSPRWSPAHTAACGLALGGLGKRPVWVNLLPAERRKKTQEPAVTAMFALLCLVAVLGGSLLINSVFQERTMRDDLDRKVAKIQAETGALAALRKQSAQLEERVRQVNSLLEKQQQPLLVLKELAQLLPPTVSLTEVTIQDEKVRVGGSTSSSASDLISVFERSAIFENAAFVSPISSRGPDRQGFQLQASLKSRFAGTNQGSKPAGTRGQR